MKRWKRRLTAWLLVLLLALGLGPQEGRAVLSEVYFTAVNEQLLDLNSETMPFRSGGVWYVSSRLFEGTDLGVNYARIYNANQAMLYNAKIDLRFDLDTQTTTDRNGKSYNGYAIERGGVIFFPLPLVCSRFGLRWSKTETETVPLIRVTSSSAVLTDREFVDAASQMRARYNEYERSVTAAEENTGGPPQTEDPPLAAEGQKVYLIIDSQSPEETLELLGRLGDHQATFLLTAEELEQADLVRALVAGGHGLALQTRGETEAEMEEEIVRARELVWQAACAWLVRGRGGGAPLPAGVRPGDGPDLRLWGSGPGRSGRRPHAGRQPVPGGRVPLPGGRRERSGRPGRAAGGSGCRRLPAQRLEAHGLIYKKFNIISPFGV